MSRVTRILKASATYARNNKFKTVLLVIVVYASYKSYKIYKTYIRPGLDMYN